MDRRWSRVCAVILTKTKFGNWIFAVGGSASAARASGVPVARVKIILFMAVAASGVLLAAIQVLSLGSADSFRGQGKEFEAAITAVIGGTSLSGGTGSIIGTAIGALTLGIVRQGLFFAGVDYDWYQAILGLMLLAAVLINQYHAAQRAEGLSHGRERQAAHHRGAVGVEVLRHRRCARTMSRSACTPARSSAFSATTAPASRR